MAFLPCLLPASRSATSFSQPPPDCSVLLGPGDPGGGGRVQQRQLPGLRRPFPDWRPGATTCSALDLSKLLKMEMQLVLPGCNASKQHACHPACLEGWLARFKTCSPSLFLIPHLLTAQAQHLPRVQADPCSWGGGGGGGGLRWRGREGGGRVNNYLTNALRRTSISTLLPVSICGGEQSVIKLNPEIGLQFVFPCLFIPTTPIFVSLCPALNKPVHRCCFPWFRTETKLGNLYVHCTHSNRNAW